MPFSPLTATAARTNTASCASAFGTCRALLLRWVCLVVVMMLHALPNLVFAQGSAFTCDVVFFQIRNKATPESMLFRFSSVSGTVTPTAVWTNTATVNVGGIGYNPIDNFIYGIRDSAVGPRLMRLGSTGVQDLGGIVGLPGGIVIPAGYAQSVGSFDSAGRFYFAGQGTTGGRAASIAPNAIFRLDSMPSIPSSSSITVSFQYTIGDSSAGAATVSIMNFGDFDFAGAGGVNATLYGAAQQADYGADALMHRIQLDTTVNAGGFTGANMGKARVTTVTFATTPGALGVGSAFWDASVNQFYVFDNPATTFYSVTNAISGAPPSFNGLLVPVPASPPTYGAGVGNTDGTSCPLSGPRIATVRAAKTDGKNTATIGSVTAYTMTVASYGPYPGNFTVVQDPAQAGLQKLSVSCSASTGPPTPTCPAGLNTTTFEAGISIPNLPVDSTLTFVLNALITAAAGTTVTNTFQATLPADTTAGTTSVLVSTDLTAVVPAQVQVVSSAQICPANTTERTTNLISNGNFELASPLNSALTIGTANASPTVLADTVSRQQNAVSYFGGQATQSPFPGDAARSVPGSDWWLLYYGDAAAAASNSRIWTTTVSGLVPGRTYQFMAYMSNATVPGSSSATLPSLGLLRVDGTTPAYVTGTTATFVPTASNNETGSDTWRLIQGTLTAPVTGTVGLAITATHAANPSGAIAGIAQVQLRECAPSPDLAVSKVGSTTVQVNGTFNYTITVAHLTTGVGASNTLIIDPDVSGISKNTLTCAVTAGTAICPSSLNLIDFSTTGLNIPSMTGLSTMVFVLTANVTGAAGQKITNSVSISSSSYTDSNLANNSSAFGSTITGNVSLGLTKTNVVTTLAAGQTVAYTITLSNLGPANVNGFVLTDTPTSGLQCTNVSCVSVVGPTTCPSAASTTIAALTGSGISLPNMIPPSSINFRVQCNVRATGL